MQGPALFIKPAGVDEIVSAFAQAGQAPCCSWFVSGAEGAGKSTLLRWLVTESQLRNPEMRIACFTASPRQEPVVGAHEGDESHPVARARAWDRHPMRPRPADDAYSAILLLSHQLGQSLPSEEEGEEPHLTMVPRKLLRRTASASLRGVLAGLTPAPISVIMAVGEGLIGSGAGGSTRTLDLEAVADRRGGPGYPGECKR